MMQGKIKWNVKNHVRVALSTENPPQIHSTRVVPMCKGRMADRRLLITVALPNDICPHGNT